jgi:hypothetical protein
MLESIAYGFGTIFALVVICSVLIGIGLFIVRLIIKLLGLRNKVDNMELNLQSAAFNKLDPHGTTRALFSIFMEMSFFASGAFYLLKLSKYSSFNPQHELIKLLVLASCGFVVWSSLHVYSWSRAAPSIINLFGEKGIISFFMKLSFLEGGLKSLKFNQFSLVLLSIGYIVVLRDFILGNQQWSEFVIRSLLSICGMIK